MIHLFFIIKIINTNYLLILYDELYKDAEFMRKLIDETKKIKQLKFNLLLIKKKFLLKKLLFILLLLLIVFFHNP